MSSSQADDRLPSSVPGPPSGLILAPFRALRFAGVAGDDLAKRTSPPFDVVGEHERHVLESADPYNVVRLILPRATPTSPISGYQTAARLLRVWRVEGALAPDPRPALYVYEMAEGGHVTRGLVGALALAAPDAGIVLPHENTIAGTVTDRLALTEATDTDLEAISLVYDGGGAASEAVAAQEGRPPLVEATTDDQITHRLWTITDPDVLAEIAADLLPRRAVIADGHHRYSTYLTNQANRYKDGRGSGPWDFGLVFLVDATRYGPRVRPIHRVLPGLPLADAVRLAGTGFTVTEVPGGEDATLDALAEAGRRDVIARHAFGLTDGRDWYLVTDPDPVRLDAALPAERSAGWRGLDVAVAHRYLIEELWGQEDSPEVVGFEHDVADAVGAVANGGTALLLNATPAEEVIAVAGAGERMPRKSTMFVPKPRSGLLMRAYADAN